MRGCLERRRVVESGKTCNILAAPSHAYTRKLLASIPCMPAWSLFLFKGVLRCPSLALLQP
ncbi:hypothetical protein [Neorhizobium sp. LjRoot104]|uniref:ABC transporter ATP-binding protein n=1 Tax=Neorhizobium sp. LjRoot104 TaxID=3342254 RepID=UPI003F5085C4